MVYLNEFRLLNEETENKIIIREKRTYLNSLYPFRIFPSKGLETIKFGDVTILYGGNGSGKSTILNIIANKLDCSGKLGAKNEMYAEYLEACKYEFSINKYQEIKIIRSDDIFDYIYSVRNINNRNFSNREALLKEYFENKNVSIHNFDDYEKLKNEVAAKKKSASSYIKCRIINNDVKEQSNGESALMYFVSEIKENGLYLLDEPENSMSAAMQLKLTKFLEESARFFHCQFIIATHSPFILGMNNTLIYDLDSLPIKVKNFEELENMKLYYDFFKQNKSKFE